MPISTANIWRSPKRWLPLSLAGLVAVGGLGTGTALTMLGDGSPVAGAQKLANIASDYAARSPGERTVGNLSDKKGASAVAGERDTAPMASAPESGPLPAKAFGAASPVLPSESIVALSDAPRFDQYAPVFPATFGPEIPAGVILPGVPGSPPGGGGGFPDGGGIVTPPVNPPITTPPPVSPVPEPATWLSMVLGFGLMGRMLRRRRGLANAKPGSVALAHGY